MMVIGIVQRLDLRIMFCYKLEDYGREKEYHSCSVLKLFSTLA